MYMDIRTLYKYSFRDALGKFLLRTHHANVVLPHLIYKVNSNIESQETLVLYIVHHFQQCRNAEFLVELSCRVSDSLAVAGCHKSQMYSNFIAAVSGVHI